MTSLAGQTVYLDANAFIFFGEGHPVLAPHLRTMFQEMDAGRVTVVTSELTLAEVLVLPLRNSRPDLVAANEKLLEPRTGFQRLPISLAGRTRESFSTRQSPSHR